MRINDDAFDSFEVRHAARDFLVGQGRSDHCYNLAVELSHRLQLHVAADLVALGGFGVTHGTGVADAWIATGAEIEGGLDAVLADTRNETCHDNCLRAVETDPTLRHVLGYALSADGLWHEHSWLKDASGRLLETTGKSRLLYAGVDAGYVPTAALALLEGEVIERDACSELAVESLREALTTDISTPAASRERLADALQRRAMWTLPRAA